MLHPRRRSDAGSDLIHSAIETQRGHLGAASPLVAGLGRERSDQNDPPLSRQRQRAVVGQHDRAGCGRPAGQDMVGFVVCDRALTEALALL